MCRWYCPNRGGRVGSRRPLEPSEVVPPGAFFMSSCCGGPLRCPGLGSKVRLSTRPPALPVGKGAGRCAPWSPRRFFLQGHFGCAADRSPLHCPGLGSKGRMSTPSPRLSHGEGEPVAALRCCPRRVLLPGFLLSCGGGLCRRPFRAVCFGVPADSVPVRPAVPVFPSPHTLFL